MANDPARGALGVIHVAVTLAPEGGGIASAVLSTAASLAPIVTRLEVASLGAQRGVGGAAYLRPFPPGWGPRRLGRSPELKRWLREAASSGNFGIIHSHGLWRMPNVYAAWAAQKGSCSLVVSPHGALAASGRARHRIEKGVFWSMFQQAALQAAACFHATSEAEFEDIRGLGFRQPVCILPHGVDIPPGAEGHGSRRVLFLGRLHPQKGLDILLRAWKLVESAFPAWELRIAGPGDPSHVESLRNLERDLSLERVEFCGPVNGQEKWSLYRDASVFVLPSPSENFGLVVAEALAAGIPAIVSRGAPWREIETRGAGWWVRPGVTELADALRAAMTLPPAELRARGVAGREWMRREYSWAPIAGKLAETYRWLRYPQSVDRPDWVVTD